MVNKNNGFNFIEFVDDCAKFSANEQDKDDIIDFLEYAMSENIVYYEALVSYELLKDIIVYLKAQKIDDGVLSLSKSRLWLIYSMYDMHRSMKDEYDNFPDGFDRVFFPLNSAFNVVFPKKNSNANYGGEG